MDKQPVRTAIEERQRLADAVAQMATAIDAGEVVPTIDELKALANICDDAHLHVEAVRVRRWMES